VLKKLKSYKFIWIGFSLAWLFFYPLTQSMFGAGQYFMSWKFINTLELLVAVLILFLIFSFSFFYINAQKSRLFKTISLIILAFLPLSFFTVHALRQFVGASRIVSIADKISFIDGLIFLCILIFVLIILKKFWLNKFYEIIIFIITSLLPLSFLSILFIFLYGLNGHIDKSGTLNDLSNQKKTFLEKNNLYVFLFDELDYSILYDKEGYVNNEYINIKKFSNKSVNYLDARAPGDATLSSITQLLLGKKIKNINVCGKSLCTSKNEKKILLDTTDNIFRTSQDLGYNTALIGWMHKYCKQYVANLDYCRSYGLYNNSSFDSRFSLLNPIYTNLIVLPHHMPFGLIKNPIYSRKHHKDNKNVHELSLKIIEKNRDNPIFLFSHFSLPHSPYLYKNKKYQPNINPFEVNIENYKEQLIYVDKLFGEIIEKIVKENQLNRSTIVILSDHAFRKISTPDEHNHVPMIVFNGKEKIYKKISESVQTEKILLSLIYEKL